MRYHKLVSDTHSKYEGTRLRLPNSLANRHEYDTSQHRAALAALIVRLDLKFSSRNTLSSSE